MSAQAQHRLFPSFAGVALADILANGAAIIIMLIVITTMIKHEQEEKRAEQVEDVSVLLSRDIATSVVMNALPTNPSARLHDYVNSPLDRNPVHSIMPIIELHTDYLRNYYTGERITRDELLLRDNAFDRYIKSLNRRQLLRMRVDVYSIRLFYIVMSILKDYKHRPNHWHFIGYPEGGGSGVPGSGERWSADKDKARLTDAEMKMQAPGEGRNGAEQQDSDARDGDAHGIPQQTELNPQPGGIENYPYDDLAFKNGGVEKQEAPKDLPGSISEPAGERERISNELFNALAQMMSQDLSGRNNRTQTRLSRFRSARAIDDEQQQQNRPGTGQEQEPLKIHDLRALLPALFEFMRQIQAEADAGSATRLAEYDFRKDVLPLLQAAQRVKPDARLNALFDRLNASLSAVPGDTDAPIRVVQTTDSRERESALAVKINERVQTAALVGNEAQERRDDLPGEVRPTLHFGLYPAIYQGLRAPVKKDALVLMPPGQNAPGEFRWRVVTMVSPAADDFMTAFVYSALDEDGQLLIASDENALSISDFRVTTNYPVLPFRNERWLMMIYGIPALLIALGVLRRVRKPA